MVGRPFVKGQVTNPTGRPIGARSKTTLAIEALLEGEAEGLTRKAIEVAMTGDMVAMRLCLERLCPPSKSRPVKFDLPKVEVPEGIVKALDAVARAMSQGELTVDEASGIAGVLETQRRAIETTDHEARLAAIEKGLVTK